MSGRPINKNVFTRISRVTPRTPSSARRTAAQQWEQYRERRAAENREYEQYSSAQLEIERRYEERINALCNQKKAYIRSAVTENPTTRHKKIQQFKTQEQRMREERNNQRINENNRHRRNGENIRNRFRP